MVIRGIYVINVAIVIPMGKLHRYCCKAVV
jgi:hypothetical protein